MSAFHSPPKWRDLLAVATIPLFLAGSGSLGAADAAFYLVSKGEAFNQNTAAPPVPKGSPARFSAVVGLAATNAATNVTVQLLPSGGVIPLVFQPGGEGTIGFKDQFASPTAKYATQSALDAAYPNGNYQFVIHTVHDGTKTCSLALNGDAYPATDPYISNFTEGQAIDPTVGFTLTWAPWSGGTVNDSILVAIGDNLGNALFTTPNPGEPGSLKGTATSITIPPNTLPGGTALAGLLTFGKTVQVNTNSYPGVPGIAAYYKQTQFVLGTAAVSDYSLAKQQTTTQNDPGPPVLAPSAPFRFIANIFPTTSNSVISASVQAPGGVNDPIPYDSVDVVFHLQKSFPTQSALDTAFMPGAYTITLTGSGGSRLLPLAFPADGFPIAPHVNNFAAAQTVDPAKGFNLTWDPFSGGTTADDIPFVVGDSLGNFYANTNLPSTTTNFYFPPKTFAAGQTYQVTLVFRKFVTVDTNTYPGAVGSVVFSSRTFVNLTTSGGAAPPPTLKVVFTNTAGPFQLLLTGQAGRLYAIEAASNLLTGSWIPLLTNTAVGGQFLFTDPQSAAFPRRFYRGRSAD